jgi:hypothetical protein
MEGIWNLDPQMEKCHTLNSDLSVRPNERRTGSFCNAILCCCRSLLQINTKMIALLAASASAFAPVAQTGRLLLDALLARMA